MIYTFIAERCSDLPISACCRVMGVSTSGFYQRQAVPVTDAELAEAYRANTVFDIWKMSRHSYGMPRIRHELRLGRGEGCSRTTVARLMNLCGAVGTHYKRRGGCTRPSDGDLNDDLVNRAFDPEGPDRLWCMDITEHPTGTGKVYLAVVLDAWSRRVVGWSIADHMRAELVADAVQMATWRRRPEPGRTVAHSDHGGQYTSWLFGNRLRTAGLLGSMGSVGDCFEPPWVRWRLLTLETRMESCRGRSRLGRRRRVATARRRRSGRCVRSASCARSWAPITGR